MNLGGCPKDETLLLLVHGELSKEQAGSIELHCSGCPKCRKRLEALFAVSQRLSSSLRTLEGPATPAAPGGHPNREGPKPTRRSGAVALWTILAAFVAASAYLAAGRPGTNAPGEAARSEGALASSPRGCVPEGSGVSDAAPRSPP